jgi:hypothetical protein
MANLDPLQGCFLAEWYQAAVVDRDVSEVAATLGDAAARLRDEGRPIRLLVTVAATADQVLYGLFAADCANTVNQACERAGWPADRISGDIRACIPC